MEIRHLRYFVAVAEERHFGRAAALLKMAQPPLSQAIRQLEEEIGTLLLERTTRTVSVTPAGELFYRDAVSLLHDLELSVARTRQLALGKSGLIRIAFTGAASYRQLPEIARLADTKLPDLVLDIMIEVSTAVQEALLLDNKIDVGVLRPPVRSDRIRSFSIAEESLLLALPNDHRLAAMAAAGRVITVADLREEPLIFYSEKGSIINDEVTKSCLMAGFSPKRAHTSPSTSIVLALAAAGLGIGFIPDSARLLTMAGVAYIPIKGVGSLGLAIAWRKDDDSPLLAHFLEVLAEANHVPGPDGRKQPKR